MMDKEKRIVTIGTFDGLHRGHREVLRTLMEEGARRGLTPTVMTFDRHPLETVAPERAPRLLMEIGERDRLLAETGAEVIRLEFTDSLRRLTAKEWMSRLANEYDAEVLVLGYDNTFGCDGAALNLSDFRRIGKETGIEVVEAPAIQGCSSSAARRAIISGNTKAASEILGVPFSLRGVVEHGRGVGRTIGVPTVNLRTSPRQLLPREGVYAATVLTPAGEFKAVVNVGRAPTLTDGARTAVEAHLLDFNSDLYGQTVEIKFGPRLRDEQKFPSVEALKLQIAADIKAVRKHSQSI